MSTKSITEIYSVNLYVCVHIRPKGDKSYTIDGNSLTMQTACKHPLPENNQIIFVSYGQRVSGTTNTTCKLVKIESHKFGLH